MTAAAQIHHGLVEAGYGYWGFSPSNVPEGGYTEYGVDGIGLNPTGYPSNNDKTFTDVGWPGCREPAPTTGPFTNGVVTRGSKVRFIREGTVIWKGAISSLYRFKDAVREVREGFECGVGIDGFGDVQQGDVIEVFEVEEVARQL